MWVAYDRPLRPLAPPALHRVAGTRHLPVRLLKIGTRIATAILSLRKTKNRSLTFPPFGGGNLAPPERGFFFATLTVLTNRSSWELCPVFPYCSQAMSLHLHPLTVTLIDREMSLAAVWVPAGFPSPAADDLEETVDPMKWVVRHEHATFWWRVSGDSLEAEGILDGDLIAVDRAGRRRSGRIVLALVDGQITVKKLAKRNGAWFLDPRARSDVYETIPVTETTEIWGVVAGVVRRLPVE